MFRRVWPLFLLIAVSSLTFGSSIDLSNCTPVFLPVQAPTQIKPCASENCNQVKADLIRIGFHSDVAERIAVYRPDVYQNIFSKGTITPDQMIIRPDIKSSDPRTKWFASQSQDREIVTVYRGMKGSGKDYDPKYYHSPEYLPFLKDPKYADISDPRIFSTDNLSKASRYSEGTLIIRLQIPRFMLYTSEGGPWGQVFFRDMIPNELAFVSGVAFIKPAETSEAAKKIVPEFISLEAALPKLPLANFE